MYSSAKYTIAEEVIQGVFLYFCIYIYYPFDAVLKTIPTASKTFLSRDSGQMQAREVYSARITRCPNAQNNAIDCSRILDNIHFENTE